MGVGDWISDLFGSTVDTPQQSAYWGGKPGVADADVQHYRDSADMYAGRAAPVADWGQANADYARSQQGAQSLGDAMGLARSAALGQAPSVAAAQQQAGLQAAQQQAASMAASARGGGANLAAANRAAMRTQEGMASNAVNSAAQLRAQETATARGQYGSLADAYGSAADRSRSLSQQQSQFGVTSQQQQMGLNDAQVRAQQQAEIAARQGQLGADQQQANLAAGAAQSNAKMNQDNTMGLIKTGAGIAMMASDVRAKSDIAPMGGGDFAATQRGLMDAVAPQGAQAAPESGGTGGGMDSGQMAMAAQMLGLSDIRAKADVQAQGAPSAQDLASLQAQGAPAPRDLASLLKEDPGPAMPVDLGDRGTRMRDSGLEEDWGKAAGLATAVNDRYGADNYRAEQQAWSDADKLAARAGMDEYEQQDADERARAAQLIADVGAKREADDRARLDANDRKLERWKTRINVPAGPPRSSAPPPERKLSPMEQAGLALITSDERAKGGIERGNTIDELLQAFGDSAATYRYKEGEDQPTSVEKPGQRFAGIMAQRVEQVPEIGHSLVTETPRGKAIEGNSLMGALAAGEGRLDTRLKDLESAVQRMRGGGAVHA